MEYAAFIKAFLALFAMMNPIGNTGIFISMTGDLPLAFKVKAAIKVTITVLIILIGAAFGGTAVLNAFGISLPAFQLAGGLIVLGIGFKMLHGGDNPAHQTDAGDSQIATVNGEEERVNSTLIVPLSMPILGGPGSIATVITVSGIPDPRGNHRRGRRNRSAHPDYGGLFRHEWIHRAIPHRRGPTDHPAFHGAHSCRDRVRHDAHGISAIFGQ